MMCINLFILVLFLSQKKKKKKKLYKAILHYENSFLKGLYEELLYSINVHFIIVLYIK